MRRGMERQLELVPALAVAPATSRIEDARPPRVGRTPSGERPLRVREQLPPRR